MSRNRRVKVLEETDQTDTTVPDIVCSMYHEKGCRCEDVRKARGYFTGVKGIFQQYRDNEKTEALIQKLESEIKDKNRTSKFM
jgi:hypothetical protein